MKFPKHIFIVATLILSMLQSCTKEDTSECLYSFDVQLSFMESKVDQENIIDKNVEKVSVYLYNQAGQFVKRADANLLDLYRSDNTYTMNVEVDAPGTYSFVVLGDSRTPDYTITSQTDINSFDVTVDVPSSGVLETKLEETYIATQREVTVEKMNIVPVVKAQLFRNNNRIDIAVVGLTTTVTQLLATKMQYENTSFNKDNATTGAVLYQPFEQQIQGDGTTALDNKFIFSYETLRLMYDRPMMLEIDIVEGLTVVDKKSVDLMNIIKNARLHDGSKVFADQLDLDYQRDYNIVLMYKDDGAGGVELTVTLNGWNVIIVTPEQ